MKITLQFECEECGKTTEAELDLVLTPERVAKQILEGRDSCCPVGPKGKRGPKGVYDDVSMADDSWLDEHDTTSEHGGV